MTAEGVRVEYEIRPVSGSQNLCALYRVWYTKSYASVPAEAKMSEGGYAELLCQHAASGAGFRPCIENAESARKGWERRGNKRRELGMTGKYAEVSNE